MKKLFLLFSTIILFSIVLAQKEIPLYDGKIPNVIAVPDPERMEKRGDNNRAFYNTSIPTLTVFRPENPNGKAVIICPGGGYMKTAFDKEGTLVAREFTKDSVAAFVLKYRIPQDSTNMNKSLAPLQDAQQAIRYLRENAAEFGIDGDKIGIMGFSAGGHLAASAATHFNFSANPEEMDKTSLRPDFVILVYPVISFTDELTHMGSRNNLVGKNPADSVILFWSNELQLRPDSPPAFLVHAADDRAVLIGNSLAYYSACIENGVPVEMHLYPEGGHGFGLYNTTTKDVWFERLINWLMGF